MNKRSSNSRNPNESVFANQPRRSKKRSSRKGKEGNESWYSNDKDRDRDSHEPSEDEVPGLEYASMFWQQPRLPQPQAHPAHNGQRLFTAMSDPSVCGYSAVPITYAMEPVSLPPMYRLYQPVVRPNYRPYRGRMRPSSSRVHNGPLCSSDTMTNGYSSLQENGWNHSTPAAYQNGDYASLPPTANIDNKDNRDELSSEHRRYSDPGLGPADLPNNSKSDSDSGDSSSSIITVGKSNKLFVTLFEQMTRMKEANSQLFRELHQAKTDLENVKTELNQFKQNVPSDYQPGMLSDIIKEIRDASIVKEEAMLSKMRLLMESQQCQRSSNLEQLRSQLERVRLEKEESEERIGKLEKEVAALRLCLNSESREIAAFEEENLALRRELQEARASRNLAEGHATKLERLMGILREKAGASEAKEVPSTMTKTKSKQKSGASSSSSGSSDNDPEPDDTVFASHDSSNSNSANNSSTSLATGPVTDL
ncbi:uncharacterized protein LOC100679973 isoform X1 [Nasonia vitripennis]|uniref:Uncharacterized protein n=1 Tax=Nasonia vitripennis TaxID=7425 RepID=A0A7M7IPC4_NASVI|nr:uncharacterized protein LOC100679973 isoform X1 [Nasonia vitripennis]